MVFLLIPLAGFCPHDKQITIKRDTPINPHERLWYAVCMVETGNNPFAYNKDEKATGISQIRPIRLDHYNRLTGKNYKLKDCYSIEISKEIFMYFAAQFRPGEIEVIARKWNGSGKQTDVYWNKIKKYL